MGEPFRKTEAMVILRDAIELKKSGRVNAAKAQWETLPAEFRTAVLGFIISLVELGEQCKPKWVSFSSPWGGFTLSRVGKVDSQTIELSDFTEVLAQLV